MARSPCSSCAGGCRVAAPARRCHCRWWNYQAEIFPTRLRSTASGGAYSLSRPAIAAMPWVLVPLLDHTSPGVLFLVISATTVLVALDVALLGPRTTGRALGDVNAT